MVSEAAEALIQLNLALMVYGDLRTCDALSVLKSHFDGIRQESALRRIYCTHCGNLQEIVDADRTAEDNPKLVKLYELLSHLYASQDARGIWHYSKDFDRQHSHL